MPEDRGWGKQGGGGGGGGSYLSYSSYSSYFPSPSIRISPSALATALPSKWLLKNT